jgi:D-glycero-alpha-D-manno-heptose-7-phosphate kinase
MIICKTPFRVSFFGGGTDMPGWTNENNGHVINSSINKFGYIFFREAKNIKNYKYKIRYYLNEEAKSFEKIKHPVIKKCIEYYNLKNKKLHITYDGDLPSRSGLGSSSSFTTGLINTINKFHNRKLSKYNLAKEVIYFEHKILKENVGYQDQIAATYGDLNFVKFRKDRFKLFPLNKYKSKKKILNENMLLFLVEGKRNASSIESKKNKKIKDNYRIYKDIYDLTNEAMATIQSNNNNKFLKNFGSLLNEYWKLKKNIDKSVSNQKIDYFCQNFIKLGANGCKLMGAGSSGFILIIADKDSQKKITNKFGVDNFIKIQLEDQGSQIIYSDT